MTFIFPFSYFLGSKIIPNLKTGSKIIPNKYSRIIFDPTISYKFITPYAKGSKIIQICDFKKTAISIT